MTQPDRETPTDPPAAEGTEDWRTLDDARCAWFAAPSLSAGAALVTRVAATVGVLPDIDLRAGGVSVRIGGAGSVGVAPAETALAISAAAGELGLAADPTGLQSVRLRIDAVDRPAVMSFWQAVLDYRAVGDDGLADPSRRSPAFSFHGPAEPRPLRNRIHVDVVRTPEAVAAVQAALDLEPSGVYGLTLTDVDGNEVDLVPGDALPDAPGPPEATDWRVLFGAMTCYPTTSAAQAARFTGDVARLADSAGVPLLVDLRPEGVTVDSGKDLWEDAFQPAGTHFADLAGGIQAAARDLGLVADPTRPRFVQFGIDAVDIVAVRAFWTAALGYQNDPRPEVTDIYDPRRLAPEIIFQDLDADDAARRAQRNRIRLELDVPADQLGDRIAAALAAGGRILSAVHTDRATIADPEGNVLEISATRLSTPGGA